MYTFKENFPELFDHICSYLHPRDLIALSATSHLFTNCQPLGFSLWRHNIIPINEFILTIDHQIKPPPSDIYGEPLPIHAGISIVEHNDRNIMYSYSGFYDGTEFYCSSISYKHDIVITIADNGKIEYKSY